MPKHKTEDYKISAVKYYLNNDKGDEQRTESFTYATIESVSAVTNR